MSYGRSQSPPGEQETFKDSLKLTSSNKIKTTHPKYLVLLSLTGNYVNMNAWLVLQLSGCAPKYKLPV